MIAITKPPGSKDSGGSLPCAAVQTPQRLIHHNRSRRTITNPTSTATSLLLEGPPRRADGVNRVDRPLVGWQRERGKRDPSASPVGIGVVKT